MQLSDTIELPPELSDRIIDFLRDDPTALAACSSTCQQWRTRAQYHLFETMSVIPATYDAFQRLMKMSPHIGRFVRTLKVSQDVKNLLREGTVLEATPLSKTVELFPLTTENFPAITRLDLHTLDGQLWTQSPFCDLRTVVELRLFLCAVPNFSSLAELLCSFPCLKKIKIHDLFVSSVYLKDYVDDVTITPQLPVTSMPAIESLRFSPGLMWGETFSMVLTKWLFFQSSYANIHTIEITIVRTEDAAFMRNFLQALGPKLQHLLFGLEPENDQDDLSTTPLTLAHSTGLRTLGFWSLKLHRQNASESPHLSWVPLLLAQVNSPCLEHVHFRIRAGGAGPLDLDALDWAQLGIILCDRRFDQLKRVTFEVLRGEGLKDQIFPFIQARMPGLEKRGITRYIHRLHWV